MRHLTKRRAFEEEANFGAQVQVKVQGMSCSSEGEKEMVLHRSTWSAS